VSMREMQRLRREKAARVTAYPDHSAGITALATILRTAGYSMPHMTDADTDRQNDMVRGLVADAVRSLDAVHKDRTTLASRMAEAAAAPDPYTETERNLMRERDAALARVARMSAILCRYGRCEWCGDAVPEDGMTYCGKACSALAVKP
jgi:RNA polymerase-binding transcription factor DksA